MLELEHNLFFEDGFKHHGSGPIFFQLYQVFQRIGKAGTAGDQGLRNLKPR
jgi:hypothetical protein